MAYADKEIRTFYYDITRHFAKPMLGDRPFCF